MLDTWLGTSPIFMIVLFFLGAGAGMLNIWRMATGHGLKVGYFDQVDPEKDMPVDRMGKNSRKRMKTGKATDAFTG